MASVDGASAAASSSSTPPASKLAGTDQVYFTDTYLFTCQATVLKTSRAKDGQICLVTDRTVMHPQGGGQPADHGMIRTLDGADSFQVLHVQKPKESTEIEHICQSETSNDLDRLVGQKVELIVNEERRRLNARLHSAGHLLDAAFVRLAKFDLVPSKGYHFADGPYVEYVGNIPNEEREKVIQQLNTICEELIKESMAVRVSLNEAGERIVNVGGTECLCGGTHVKNTAEIVGLMVTRIKKNKKNVKVSYTIAQ